MSALFFYCLFYFLMSGCIIYPPTEFISAGLTIKDIFSSWLGNENECFIQYHIRRSIVTLFVHSMLPFGFIPGLVLFGYVDPWKVVLGYDNIWLTLVICTISIPLYTLYNIIQWSVNNWSMHPIAQSLAVYCNNNTTWLSIASEINREYRRIDKFLVNTNSVTRLIVTDNWIIMVTPYKLQLAEQRDVALIVNKSDTHAMSPTTRSVVQFINIQVKPTRTGARSKSFDIRLNALDFKDLQNKASCPITVLENVTFHKTLLDRFIDAFKERVNENSQYETTEELELCIGCMEAMSNVKLVKQCSANISVGPTDCMTCNCRPMWCIDCMAKWFASRQDKNTPETWLSSKCTCPICRARFCVLDVSLACKS